MGRWRLACGAILLSCLGIPALLPLWQLFFRPKAWLAWIEYDRLLSLGFESLSLALGGSVSGEGVVSRFTLVAFMGRPGDEAVGEDTDF